MDKAKDSCLSCMFLGWANQAKTHYICNAMRLPSPSGEYEELPTRTGGYEPYWRMYPVGWRLTNGEVGRGFAWTTGSREDSKVSRWIERGPVEGMLKFWYLDELTSFEYTIAPCPAHRLCDKGRVL